MLNFEIPAYFQARRDALMKKNEGATFIFPSTPVHLRNPDVPYPFRQESSFYYLSGFDEEESCLVLSYDSTAPKKYRSTLFVQKRDPRMELWEGERYGTDRAKSTFSVDQTFEIGSFWKELPNLLKETCAVYATLGKSETFDRKLTETLHHVRKSFGRSGFGILSVLDPSAVVGEMRVIKSKEEIETLRKACGATSKGHIKAMQSVNGKMNESDIEALLAYEFRKGGCQRLGYGSIVAGGKNACCLHYNVNNESLNEGDLLLVDAGGEYNYYTSDITRTYPIGKTFTSEQKAFYELVLEANKQVIELVKPGVPYENLHKKSQEVLAQGLKDLGLVDGSVAEIIEDKEKLFRYFPHGTGHFLGIDVHDVGLYKKDGQSTKLEEGMVFTVEPGLYGQPTDPNCPDQYKGIGVRIEDNILVTKDGYENLTSEVPKEVADVEACRK